MGRGLRKLVSALLLACAQAAGAETLDAAWLRDGRVEAVALADDGAAPPARVDAATNVPLGSLWKLFVYVHAADTGIDMPDYHCKGRLPEEVYCCDAGGSVDRDAALAQSCGLFFTPSRLMVERATWQRYWSARLASPLEGELAWLADPAGLVPERLASLGSLLRAFGAIPAASRADAENALLRVVQGGGETVRWFGSRLRVKTYSWHRPDRPEERLGGGAGWLADGTPVWFGATGTGAGVLRKWGPRLAASLPPVAPALDAGCVVVDFFTRYPVRSLTGPNGPAIEGPLLGRHVVAFENGQQLAFRGDGSMTMLREGDSMRIQGRFGTNEYVARVLEREADTAQPEAARALAVAARSYLEQNARAAGSCQRIADSSATQSVGPNPAGPAALAIAQWTDRLVIEGATVRYHRDAPAPGVMAWTEAVRQAEAGLPFDAILAHAYPGGVLGIAGVGQRCRRLFENEAWLARMLPRWERILLPLAGYERPPQLPLVCALSVGAPYSEQSRNRVFMRPLATREDRITLAHEYLHIALRRHPRGQDETYVEGLARRLLDTPSGSP